jgi:hypothetical protein
MDQQPRSLRHAYTRTMSVLMIVVGVALVIRTLTAGGGPITLGMLLGVLFVAAGAFDESGYVPEVMATATRLAARRRRGIHVLVTIAVPASSPIDAALPTQEAAAQSIIEEAKVQVGRRVSGTGRRSEPGRPAAGSSMRRVPSTPRRSSCRCRVRVASVARWRPCCVSDRAG